MPPPWQPVILSWPAAPASFIRDSVGAVGTQTPSSDLLAIAAICGLLANAVNNLPAILIALPALAGAIGPGPVLAALIGVNIGPNLTYVGSLATLLWRRVLRAEGCEVGLGEFSVLALLTVPAGIVASTVALWLGLHWLA